MITFNEQSNLSVIVQYLPTYPMLSFLELNYSSSVND